MNRVSLGLIALALGLGAWIYFGEILGDQRRTAAELAERALFDFDANSIVELDLPLAGEDRRARARRGESGWQILAPLEDGAESTVLDRIAEAFADLESKTTLSEVPASLEDFLLGPGARFVRATTSDGREHVLYLGAETPVGATRYVAIQDPPTAVFTVDVFATKRFEEKLDDLRDRRIVAFAGADVEAARVYARGNLVAAAERAADSWKIVEPVADDGDARTWSRLVEDLALSRASAFVDHPGNDAMYGLDAPEVLLELVVDGETHGVELGKGGGLTWARVDGARIYQVHDRLVDGVPRELFELRAKTIIDLVSDEIARIELVFPRADTTYAFALEDGVWLSEGAAVVPKPLKVEDLVFALEQLDATASVSGETTAKSLGLDPPRVRVRALDGDGRLLEELELGDPSSSDGLAARAGGSDRLWRVPNELGADIPLGLDAFRNNFLDPGNDSAAQPAN